MICAMVNGESSVNMVYFPINWAWSSIHIKPSIRRDNGHYDTNEIPMGI